MAALYFFAGTMNYTPDPRGRTILRFTAFERFVHWLTASTFVLLALTGLNMVLGRVLLQPVIGDAAFYQITLWGKLAHNFFGFAFIVGLALMSVQWLRENLPRAADIAWLKALGGHVRRPASASLEVQRRAEDDLLARGVRRRPDLPDRAWPDIPVLRHRHLRHADHAGAALHRRRAR